MIAAFQNEFQDPCETSVCLLPIIDSPPPATVATMSTVVTVDTSMATSAVVNGFPVTYPPGDGKAGAQTVPSEDSTTQLTEDFILEHGASTSTGDGDGSVVIEASRLGDSVSDDVNTAGSTITLTSFITVRNPVESNGPSVYGSSAAGNSGNVALDTSMASSSALIKSGGLPTSIASVVSVATVFLAPDATNTCPSGTEGQTYCRDKITCDRSKQLYPRCDNGVCKCDSVPCDAKAKSTCNELYPQQCREDELFECINNVLLGSASCHCTPKVVGCLFTQNPHTFCQSVMNCTESQDMQNASLPKQPPAIAQCVTRDDWKEDFPLGRCACQPMGCSVKLTSEDEASCRIFTQCTGKLSKSRCMPKQWDSLNRKQTGFCACGT